MGMAFELLFAIKQEAHKHSLKSDQNKLKIFPSSNIIYYYKEDGKIYVVGKQS